MTTTTETTTPKARKPRPKPERRARFACVRPGLATLDLIIGDKWFSYYVEPLPCDFEGFEGYRVTKCRSQQVEGQESTYDVLLDVRPDLADDEPRLHDCDCRGRQAHAHKGVICKHLAALLALRASGDLAAL